MEGPLRLCRIDTFAGVSARRARRIRSPNRDAPLFDRGTVPRRVRSGVVPSRLICAARRRCARPPPAHSPRVSIVRIRSPRRRETPSRSEARGSGPRSPGVRRRGRRSRQGVFVRKLGNNGRAPPEACPASRCRGPSALLRATALRASKPRRSVRSRGGLGIRQIDRSNEAQIH